MLQPAAQFRRCGAPAAAAVIVAPSAQGRVERQRHLGAVDQFDGVAVDVGHAVRADIGLSRRRTRLVGIGGRSSDGCRIIARGCGAGGHRDAAAQSEAGG